MQGPDQTLPDGDLEMVAPSVCGRQVSNPDIGDQVPEVVDENHFAVDRSVRVNVAPVQVEHFHPVHDRPEVVEGHALGQMSGHRSEDIPPVERPRNLGGEVLVVLNGSDGLERRIPMQEGQQ